VVQVWAWPSSSMWCNAMVAACTSPANWGRGLASSWCCPSRAGRSQAGHCKLGF